MRFEGVFVATVTPFDLSGHVDFSALSKHLDWLSGFPIAGFVPCGTTGEASTLTETERDRILAITITVAQARKLKVIAGCGSNSTRVAEELIVKAKEAGCDAALVVAPYYNRPSSSGIEAHYSALADANQFPLILYNVPARTGVNLTSNMVSRLLRHSNIIGIKEASGNHTQWLDLSTAIDWREKSLLSGDDDAFATLMGLGACGIISATANVIPEEFVNLYHAGNSGDFRQAFRIQKEIAPLIRAAFIESNPGPIKLMLNRMGRMSEKLRLPLVSPTDISVQAIEKVLRDSKIL